MGLFKKTDVEKYAISETKAKRNYKKYKETNNSKFQDKATYNYAKRDALAIKLANPETKIENNSLKISGSFNKTKTVKTNVPVKVSIKTSKKIKKK